MFNKSLIATTILAASTGLAFANGGTYTPHALPHSGQFYIGVSANRSFSGYDMKQSTSYNYTVNSTPPIVDSDTYNTSHEIGDIRSGKARSGYSIFAGYGVTFSNHYYLGAELFSSVDNQTAKYNSTNSFGKTFITDMPDNPPNIKQFTHFYVPFSEQKEIKLKNTYGISLISGVKPSKMTLLYGRVGIVMGRFELMSNFVFKNRTTVYTNDGFYLLHPPGFNFNLPMNTKLKKTKAGIQVGAGIEAAVTHNHRLSIRAEYDWSIFGSLKASNRVNQTESNEIIGTHNFSFSNTIKVQNPTFSQFKLAAIYRFAS